MGKPIVRLLDPLSIEMVVDIPENLISLAPLVDELFVVFDTFPDVVVTARISEIGAEASATTRTYPVTLAMEQPEGIEILPGMAGRVWREGRVETAGSAQFTIPPAAVFIPSDEEATSVWVVDPESLKVGRRQVVLAAPVMTGLPVIEGLVPGEILVTAGVHSLVDGQEVSILEE